MPITSHILPSIIAVGERKYAVDVQSHALKRAVMLIQHGHFKNPLEHRLSQTSKIFLRS